VASGGGGGGGGGADAAPAVRCVRVAEQLHAFELNCDVVGLSLVEGAWGFYAADARAAECFSALLMMQDIGGHVTQDIGEAICSCGSSLARAIPQRSLM
jgi:hypothetical protein